MTDRRKRIVIVGGSFAGLTAAIKLSPRHAVTVVAGEHHELITDQAGAAVHGVEYTRRASMPLLARVTKNAPD